MKRITANEAMKNKRLTDYKGTKEMVLANVYNMPQPKKKPQPKQENARLEWFKC